jgi:hypothetical protein
MRQPIAKQSAVERVSHATASVNAEVAVAEAVALLHAVTELEPTDFGNGRDEYIRAGFQTLAGRASDKLIQAFNQLDTVIATGNK